jgi:hypothetical protein
LGKGDGAVTAFLEISAPFSRITHQEGIWGRNSGETSCTPLLASLILRIHNATPLRLESNAIDIFLILLYAYFRKRQDSNDDH